MDCPPLLIDAPPLVAPTGGLFSVATFPELPEGLRWPCGFSYPVRGCTTVGEFEEVCPPEVPVEKLLNESLGWTTSRGTTAYYGEICQALGRLREAQATVRAGFAAGEQRFVEQWFIDGLQVTLEDPDDPEDPGDPCTVLGAGAVDIVEAVGLIEDEMGDRYGGQPIIHAPRGVSAYAADHNLVVPSSGGRLTTPIGTRWAFGAGYSGALGPTGQVPAAGTAWLYVTGQVTLLRSEVFLTPPEVEQGFNPRSNELIVIAERNYLAAGDCACAAVLVQLEEAP